MVKMSKWNSIPIENEIVGAIIKNHGEILTTDLFRQLMNKYEDLTKADLTDTLFRLEVRSYIIVIPIKKDVMRIELNPRAAFSEDIKKTIKDLIH